MMVKGLHYNGIKIIICRLLREVMMGNYLCGILCIKLHKIVSHRWVISSSIRDKFRMLVGTIFMTLYSPHVMMVDTLRFGIWETLTSQFTLCKIIKEQSSQLSSRHYMNIYGQQEVRIESQKFGMWEMSLSHCLNGKLVKMRYQIWDGLRMIKHHYGQLMNRSWLCGMFVISNQNMFMVVIWKE